MQSSSNVEVEIQALLIKQEDTYFGDDTYEMPRVIRKFQEAKLGEPVEKKITLQQPLENHTDFLIYRGTYTFNIAYSDIKRIANHLLLIAINPLKVAELLQNLDKALGEKLYGMESKDESESEASLEKLKQLRPAYYIAGRSYWIPGPPEDKNYRPAKKGKLLDQLLLERERAEGINEEGYAARFIGSIEEEEAIDFIAKGHLFSEDAHINQLLLHGKYTHRLFFEAIRQAIATNQFSVVINNASGQLTTKQLLELLVKTSVIVRTHGCIISSYTLWDYVFDLVFESPTLSLPITAARNRLLLLPENYRYSCRTPESMNSLLICFGKKLGLPNLRSYLLDSHYKAAIRMVTKVRDNLPSKESLPFCETYTCCMVALVATSTAYVTKISSHAFSSTTRDRRIKYQQDHTTDRSSYIGKKIRTTTESEYGFYDSLDNYILTKKNQDAKLTFLAIKDQLDAGSFSVCTNKDKLLQDIELLIYSIVVHAGSKQEKQANLKKFLENKRFTVSEVNDLFILIKDIESLHTHTNPTLDRCLGIRNTTSWQSTIMNIQEMAYKKLNTELQNKPPEVQRKLLEKARSMTIFNADKANLYPPSLFQRLRETYVRDKINQKLIALNQPSVADTLHWIRQGR